VPELKMSATCAMSPVSARAEDEHHLRHVTGKCQS